MSIEKISTPFSSFFSRANALPGRQKGERDVSEGRRRQSCLVNADSRERERERERESAKRGGATRASLNDRRRKLDRQLHLDQSRNREGGGGRSLYLFSTRTSIVALCRTPPFDDRDGRRGRERERAAKQRVCCRPGPLRNGERAPTFPLPPRFHTHTSGLLQQTQKNL